MPARQRLLIREANFLRGLVGLPPVGAAGKDRHRETSGSDALYGDAGSGRQAKR